MELTATDLINSSLKYIEVLSPFALVFTAIFLGDELIKLVKRTVTIFRERG